MIENWRYQRAIQPNPHQILEKRLDTEFILQQKMNQLGISPESNPYELVAIDKLITKKISFPLRKPIVEILGMPCTGKTTVLEKISEDLITNNYLLVPDTFHQITFTYPPAEKHIAAYLNLVDQLPENQKAIVERGIIDKIIYTHFWSLYGKINVVSDIISSWIDKIETPNDFSLVVLCLAKPETCQQRGSKTPINFLKSLYEQYLCLHFDILNSKRIPNTWFLLSQKKLTEAILQNL